MRFIVKSSQLITNIGNELNREKHTQRLGRNSYRPQPRQLFASWRRGWCVEVGTAVKDGIERSECFAGKTCRRMLAHVITPQSPPDPLHNANGQMEEVGCVYTCTCECVKGQYSKHKKDSTCQHIPQVSSLCSQDPTIHLSPSLVLVQYACREVNGRSLLLNMQSRHHSM